MRERGVVIVTGGASGIGLAAVRALVQEGWRALAVDMATDNLARAQQELAEFSDRVRYTPLDVTDEANVIRVVEDCDVTFGPVRGLVNSAGIARDVPFFETTSELFSTILAVNLTGAFLVAREAGKRMRDHGGGAIVNIASVSGLRGNIGRSAYGASKGGVTILTQVMAVELAAFNIRVNAVAPGPVETPLVSALHSPSVREQWLRSVPLRRYATPDEIAGTICYLLDERRSSFVTGQILAVDGGFTAGGLLASS